MTDGDAPVAWSGRRAVVTFPERAAADMPAHAARERISDALRRLDDAVHEIRDHVVRSRPPGTPL